MSADKTFKGMIGEFLREVAVLVSVFGTLDPVMQGRLTTLWFVIVVLITGAAWSIGYGLEMWNQRELRIPAPEPSDAMREAEDG